MILEWQRGCKSSEKERYIQLIISLSIAHRDVNHLKKKGISNVLEVDGTRFIDVNHLKKKGISNFVSILRCIFADVNHLKKKGIFTIVVKMKRTF